MYIIGYNQALHTETSAAIQATGSYLYGDTGNTSYAAVALGASVINIGACTVNNNTYGGYCYSIGTILATGASFTSNTIGLYVSQGGAITANTTTFTSNTYGVIAQQWGYVYVNGYTDGGGNTTLFTPKINTRSSKCGLIDDGTGLINEPGAIGSPRTAATSAINTTETIIAGGATAQGTAFSANTFSVSSTVRITVEGSCNSSHADVQTFSLHFGISGNATDTLIGSATVTSAGFSTELFEVTIQITFVTIGASGSIIGYMKWIDNSMSGFNGNSTGVKALTVAAPNTTTANFFTLTYQSAASTTSTTFNHAVIEIIKQ